VQKISITMAKKKNKFVEYVKDSYNELVNKVSWPTWSELQNSAIVVSIASLIIALIVFLMDQSFEFLLEQYYSLF
jgi:preprotein translocase subunit SecE